MDDFPDDADGDVLRTLKRQGVDMSLPRAIEFYCFAQSRPIADRIAKLLDGIGFKSDVFVGKEDEKGVRKISVYSAKFMILDYNEIVRIQAELNEVLLPFGTHCDGWGTLVDPQETSDASNKG